MSTAFYGVRRVSGEDEYRTRISLAPLNGALSITQIVFDLRNWAGHYVCMHCDGTDAYVQFSDVDFATIDPTATLLVAPNDTELQPTACCFKLAEGSSENIFVHPAYPYLHAVRAYPLNGYLRIVRA